MFFSHTAPDREADSKHTGQRADDEGDSLQASSGSAQMQMHLDPGTVTQDRHLTALRGPPLPHGLSYAGLKFQVSGDLTWPFEI